MHCLNGRPSSLKYFGAFASQPASRDPSGVLADKTRDWDLQVSTPLYRSTHYHSPRPCLKYEFVPRDIIAVPVFSTLTDLFSHLWFTAFISFCTWFCFLAKSGWWHTVAHCGTLWHTVAHCGTGWRKTKCAKYWRLLVGKLIMVRLWCLQSHSLVLAAKAKDAGLSLLWSHISRSRISCWLLWGEAHLRMLILLHASSAYLRCTAAWSDISAKPSRGSTAASFPPASTYTLFSFQDPCLIVIVYPTRA